MKTNGKRNGTKGVMLAAAWAVCGACACAASPAVAAKTAAQTQTREQAPGGRPGTEQRSQSELREMAAVEQFLRLSDAELDQLAQVIARIRAMTTEQRAALTREVGAYRKLPEQQRWQMRQGWGQMPRDVQDAWREMMQNATEEKRAEIQARMPQLGPEEKVAYRKKLVEEYLREKAAKK